MSKGKHRKFLSGFSFSQLKDYVKQQHEKAMKKLLIELPFYEISIEKSYIKRLNNIDMLHELPFYDKIKYCENIKSI